MPFARLNRTGNREGSMTQIHGEVAEGFGAVADADLVALVRTILSRKRLQVGRSGSRGPFR